MVRWLFFNVGILAVAYFSSGCGRIWGTVSWNNQPPSNGINLEVPIELLESGSPNLGISSNTSTIAFSRTRTSLTTTDYDGTVVYSYEVVANNSDAVARNVSLLNTSGAVVANISIPSGSAVPTRFRSIFIPTPGASDYRMQFDGTTVANQLNAFSGHIIVSQAGATKTKIFVPLVNGYNNYTGVASSNADDNTQSIDSGAFGGSYNHNSPYHYALWNKNTAAFSQLATGNAYTFEAVISTSTAGTTTAYASIFDYTSNNQIVPSVVSTTSTTPTLVSMSFPDSSANFTNGDDMELRFKNDGPGDNAYLYRAGLWISLVNLTHAEVYYRYGFAWFDTSGSGAVQSVAAIMMLNTSVFSSPVSIFHEGTGYLGTLGTPCTESVYDIGSADSGTVGADVPGSGLTFTTLASVRTRTAALPWTSGHRFTADMAANPGPGNCYIIQERVVVGF